MRAWLARGAGGESADVAGRVARWAGARGATTWRSTSRATSARTGCWRSSGARRRVGFAHAGGGPLLTDVVAFDGGRHVADNGLALVERAFDLPAGSLARADTKAGAPLWRLPLPEAARAAASAALAQLGGARRRQTAAAGRPCAGRPRDQAMAGRAIRRRQRRCSPPTSAPPSSSPAAPGDEAVVERDGVALERAWRADAARAGHNGSGRARGHAAPMPRAAHGRHRADAPGSRRRHARAGGFRAVDALALRAAGRTQPRRPRRSALQSVQSHPPAARTLSGTHARLSRRGARRSRRRCRPVAPGVAWRRRAGGGTVSSLEVETASGRRRDRHRQPAGRRRGRARRRLGQSVDQATATRARGRRRFAGPVHASRRLALVVHRDLPASDARRHAAHRAVTALERLAGQDPGARWFVDGSDAVVGHVARQVAARHGIACEGPADLRAGQRGTGTRAKALFHTATAMADRLRPTLPHGLARPGLWRSCTRPLSAVTPEKRPMSARSSGHSARELPDGVALVGLGPRTNFRVRRWRDRLQEFVNPQPGTSPPRR